MNSSQGEMTDAPVEPTPTTSAERWAVGAMLATTVLVMGNVVVVTPVLAEIASDLRASQAEIQLIGDALPVVLAALLLPCGALLDRHGRRRGLLCGLAVMVISLLLSAAATTADALIATRCLAGAGAALAFPGTLSTITAVLPAASRDKGVALWSGACMLGGVWALIFAGAIAEVADMRTLFVAMAAVTAACLVAVAVVMPETTVPGQATPDAVGSIAAVVGVGSLAYGISAIPVDGLLDARVLSFLLIGSAGIAAFVVRCLRVEHPLLDVRIFRIPMVSLGVLAIFVPFVCSQAWFFLGFQYNTYVFGWGPLQSALGIAPAALTIVPFAVLGSVVTRRVGVARLLVATLFIDAVASVILGAAGLTRSFPVIALATMAWGIGIGLAQAPATQLVLDALPARAQGVASALNDLSRELGAAAGIAVLGSAFNAAYRSSVTTSSPDTQAVIADSPAQGIAAAGLTGDAALLDVVRDAVAHGWFAGFVVAGVAILAIAITVAAQASRTVRAAPASNQGAKG